MKTVGISAVTLDTETLAALVMELGSQLHIERARRVALEEALAAAGVLTQEAICAAGSDRLWPRASTSWSGKRAVKTSPACGVE